MESTENIIGVAVGQIVVSGDRPASLSDQERPHTPRSALQAPRVSPISLLPIELLGVVFQLKLSSLDVMSWFWSNRECHPYMAELYTLRRVSTLWRDVVDGTPSLWTVISSTFPPEVNQTSLARSGAYPLLIYSPGPRWGETPPPLREFLQTVKPHLHRWGSVALRLSSESVEDLPRFTSLRLDTLKIDIGVEPEWEAAEILQATKQIEISDETLRNIQFVDLTLVPMDWSRAFRNFRDLRSLSLDGVYGGGAITHQQILDVLAASPNLETLLFTDLEIQDHSSPSTRQIFLPRLQSITLTTSGPLTESVLRAVQVPPNIGQLDIRPTSFLTPDAATSFWLSTMVPWAPVVQQLYQESYKSVIRLMANGTSRLETYFDEHGLFIEFKGLSTISALLWLRDVIGAVAMIEEGGSLRVYSKSMLMERDDVLAVLQTIPGITEISVELPTDGRKPSLEPLLNVLAQPTADTIHTTDPIPSFPCLTSLDLREWRWGLHGILDTLQRRYSMRSTTRHHVPDLNLDMSTYLPWSIGIISREIIPFSTLKALRELNGVGVVRTGFLGGQSGTAAVIWDEEASSPAWG
ncbi:hypothetical protein FRC04_009051 [Tulasnella sp. 424]|nr:hypothetical protein FRC04_009051 [Tulasnella sp. 424]KAG8973522.1 hypothetical protein FRC05_008693 [Tulasnella sp. 425]